MVRVTKAVASRKRRKRIIKQAKGYYGDRKNHIRQTKNAVMKALAYNTIHRKMKKGDFRRLWITRIGIASRIHGISYSKMIDGLKKAGSQLDRKMLSEMAIHDPMSFASVIAMAKQGLA